MNNENNGNTAFDSIDRAIAGDKEALGEVIEGVRDRIFNLSLRMLGTFADAEDATQDIILKVITHLSSFRKESKFETWVFRIAVNYLKDYKKHMFARAGLTFEYYGDDIANAKLDEAAKTVNDADRGVLAEELKMSCTNVMLQCLDAESRCIFVLGTMFKADSRTAGEILGISPDTYRQRLSRIRRKVGGFLKAYCGEYGGGKCRCADRLDYAAANRRLDPTARYYTDAETTEEDKIRFIEAMDEIDDLSAVFAFMKTYAAPEKTRKFFDKFLASTAMSVVKNA